ncbi:MAG: 1-deoxy-D-xylulose-5-phosphate reductoisomerase [Bacillota bacterium]|nr:1-deoxy-D-xylulose-5-phosphate reductoisomerase [Bacillota bacterium]
MTAGRPQGQPRSLVVLGSTGSIGRQALEVVRADPQAFNVIGLAAGGGNPALLREQVGEFRPAHVGLADADADLAGADWPGRLHLGPHAAESVVRAARADVVLDAIAGFVGLDPALAALEAPCLLAMAGKEAIVAAGHLLLEAAQSGGGVIVPVDSEPCAMAQCLANAGPRGSLRRVYLTASGGPFWSRPRETLDGVSPAEAVRHPRWAMGPKISVDSATLFNKGLEAIEISRLFRLPLEMIQIVVHPQSVVHALIELGDGSLLAQLGPTDMRVPISQALYHPGRAPEAASRLRLPGLSISFEEPDPERWPCLAAALAAGALGGTMPAVVSAADEVLVREFLAERVSFGDIGRGIWAALGAYEARALEGGPEPSLGRVVEADGWARTFAARWAAGDRPPTVKPAGGGRSSGRPGEVDG